MAFGGIEVENPKLDMEGDLQPRSTFLEGTVASLQTGYEQTPVKSLAESYALRFFEYGKKASAEELNKKYPFMPEPFFEDEDIGRAAEMAARVQKRQELQRTVDEGPGGFAYGLTTFAANMLPHAVDPLNVAAGMGVTSLIARAGIAAKIGSMATTAGGKAAVGVGVQAVDMIIGNMPGELAAQAAEATELRGGSIETAMVNSLVGAGFGMGLIGASKGLRWLSKKGTHIENMALSTSAVQVHEGHPPVVDTILKTVLDETNIKHQKYEFEPLVDKIKDPKTGAVVLDQRAGPLYIALDDSSGDVLSGKSLPAGQDHLGDDLVYLTDNKNHANSTAASSFKSSPGSIAEVSIEGKRVLDLDNPPDGFKDLSKEMLFSNDSELAKSVVAVIKEGGYDGFIYTAKEVAGEAHSPHNAVVLFDKEKITTRESFAPDQSKVKQMTSEDMQKIHKDAKSDFIMTEKSREPIPFSEDQKIALESDDFSHIEQRINQEVSDMEKLDTTNIKDKTFVDEIATTKKNLDDEYSLMKKGMGCLLGLIGG